jgi:hypothetical protein
MRGIFVKENINMKHKFKKILREKSEANNDNFYYIRFQCKICGMLKGNHYLKKFNRLYTSSCYYIDNGVDIKNGENISCEEFLLKRVLL